jgi:hypothetical protein
MLPDFMLIFGLFLPYLSLADPEIVSPAAGHTAQQFSSLTVRWEETGAYPLMSSLESYNLHLCTGGIDHQEINNIWTFLTDGEFTKENYVNVSLKQVPNLEEDTGYILLAFR